jgi:membrane-associated protein
VEFITWVVGFMTSLVDIFLHLDKHLGDIIRDYGTFTHVILFIVVFCETGLVVTPFLPGDSLLFAAGSFAAIGSLDYTTLMITLIIAAVLGDTVNYWIGHLIGPRVFSDRIRFLKHEYLVRTQRFYEKHGGKTIVIARFVPIIRTFAPFVAGVGAMNYRRFIIYNVAGGVAWVVIFVSGGYFFGNIPAVKANFSLVLVAIIVISVMPMVVEYFRARREAAREAAAAAAK